MKMKIFFGAFVLAVMGLTLTSCDNDVETIEVQDLYKYDAQYFANLREFKKSDHEISYAYYASWANSQNPTSWGERFLGLPDSLDIVNLWIDIPTKEKYPIAYQDMKYCQDIKGTRFVMHADASHYGQQFWYRDENFNVDTTRVITLHSGNEEELRAYARWAVDTVMKCELDGVDFDYEGWSDSNMHIVADECNKYFGPAGQWPDKLFIIDFFGGSPSSCDEYCDYFVRQAYSWQIGFQTGSSGRPVERTVLCESTGAEAQDGGVNGAMVREYAAFKPAGGRKGGFGAYYIDYNYKSQSGIPYKEFREAIQIQNPALNK
ncbi:glycoside hydrolase family 18 [Prevotella sp. KH2C16]|uniref:glycoside hydrolase family 18 n=1 Tax=Prevotella sp. KH2C16 TaxID=1855325 RepID=UPI0008EFDA1D|nr:glycoside hydrolase family 18 [Prevotella sp. KH2C16]SFG03370.1 Putative glycoside hydrolase Family 18, chitinase_18 [Prevotella sp. KH2C16]